jgi:hypothetical protein
LALLVALFTGFGNMPIYKRYYVSAVPGLGWSGNFYVNVYIHYIAGAVLLAIAAYFLVVYLRTRLDNGPLTISGVLRATMLGLTLLTGALLALRNLSQVNIAFVPQMATAFVHLGAVMLLLVFSIVCGVVRIPWRRRS